MSKKNKPDSNGFVYSTNPDFSFEEEQNETETLLPNQQKLRVRLETKHRGGKTVTLITGFVGAIEAEEELGKKIKSHCGTGGAVKDGEIIVQGNHVQKVVDWLVKNGYTQTKKSGG